MEITLNGKNRDIPDASCVQDLLQELGLAGRRLALEINQEIVPRSTFGARQLQSGDRIEIVHAIGGG